MRMKKKSDDFSDIQSALTFLNCYSNFTVDNRFGKFYIFTPFSCADLHMRAKWATEIMPSRE